MQDKTVIFTIRGDWTNAKPFYVEAITAGFTTFLLPDGSTYTGQLRSLGRVDLIDSRQEEHPDYLLLDGRGKKTEPDVIEKLSALHVPRCARVSLNSKEDESFAIELGKAGFEFVMVRAGDWKVIPLENLIAEFQKLPGRLIAEVNDLQEATVFIETLETGVDGVLVTIDADVMNARDFDFAGWKKYSIPGGTVDIVDATVTRIEEIGSGDRVCVDTITMLNFGEGILVGNHAKGFFLVHGEVADTEFVNARPFRVNAGAVHSYVLLPANKTGYLSELKAGGEVLIVDHRGRTRTSRVGRAKIETRPMLLIEAKAGEQVISAVLQNAETICLVGKAGKQVSVSKLKIGDTIKVFIAGSKGRHFGKDIDEKIIEK
nr:3-dehydroquinate synthase II [Candidatus Sigynarchaeota archaeon]